ncbi:NYN domain-containing protein [Microbacterium sp. CBA3102]|nr:NYN domain-containing protein [Microbacterium sp. CBA3102]QEA28230.1 NYN domain-containing protein [Microbacterium sp. CBA3102]
MVVMDTSGVCLIAVDYDNAFPPSTSFTAEEVSQRVTRWLQLLESLLPSISQFEVRLYGGWYDDLDLSRRGSEVAAVLPELPQFPRTLPTGRILRGIIEMAGAPIFGPTAPLLETYRVRGSLPRVRVAPRPLPDSCTHEASAACPAMALKSFTRHGSRECPVPACSSTASDVFVSHEQKMVDTMIATDVVAASLTPDGYEAIVVISGDSDFVPPMLTAHRLGEAHIIQICPREDERADRATALLEAEGVTVIEESHE